MTADDQARSSPTSDLLAYLKRLDPEVGSFVSAITKFYFDFHWEWEHLIGCVINDPGCGPISRTLDYAEVLKRMRRWRREISQGADS